ncbi:B-cell receptor CD22-like isoform X1 [Denticeps clupeoides]|uniref:B-cell receptor CD22-like isoform X1 n=1 Tax=Denticeps clupeoides TaxID=299321 RepID=UPI0010A2FF56|nr:B-cell receptor CD22-like isoform X1 [Denticeps clupeoides]
MTSAGAARSSMVTYATINLLMIQGLLGERWDVKYSTRSICALRGAPVWMSCHYTLPSGFAVRDAFWCECEDGKTRLLPQDADYQSRVHAACTLRTNRCTLNITRLSQSDAHEYNCRITTSHVFFQGWTGNEGIVLSVTDLSVEIVGAATEGNDVRLVCKTSCNLSSSPTYSWKKNGEPLEKEPTKNNELLLHPVSREDGGRYSCAVKGHEDLSSAEVELSVRYSPKDTVVFIRHHGEVDEGGSVTLSCSSDANPPVQNYTWFKENVTSPVAAGQNFTITNFTSAQVGLYSCQARNEVGVQNSAAVSLLPRGRGTRRIVTVTLAVTAVLVVLCGITLFVLRRRKDTEPSGYFSSNNPTGTSDVASGGNKTGQKNQIYQSLDLSTAVHHDNIYETLYSTNI